LGMSGSLRVVDSRSEVKKHDHVDLVLANKKILRFNDPRRFGAFLWTQSDPLQHWLLATLGPEPLSRAFTADYLAAKVSGRKQAIKLAIMDSKVVVGVGNIYASEALFYAGIRPQAMANSVGIVRLEQLVVVIQEVLRSAIRQGGTTLRNFVNPQGTPGYFKQALAVYDRAGLPCVECQKPLSHTLLGQRATYYCVHCQR
jgi:formamidopyrimidine-DNA glycosylase